KEEWQLSDKQLGALVSIISIVVAVGGIPVALLADRVSRVKSIVVMAGVWSVATISCMFTTNFAQLFTARAVVGAGETGYGSVGAALIATLFPMRLRRRLARLGAGRGAGRRDRGQVGLARCLRRGRHPGPGAGAAVPVRARLQD